MALVYDLQFKNDFTGFNIVYNNDNTNAIEVSIDENTNLIEQIKNLPLFKDTFTITFQEVFGNNYNSIELYDTVWKRKDIGGSGKDLFQTLKSNVQILYGLIKDDAKFKPAMNVYLKPSNAGVLTNADYFPSLVAKRHMLYKIITLLYVSFTVAEETMCETEESQELDYQKARARYNKLLKLLDDTTNLLLNIDVINKNPTIATRENVNVATRGNVNVMLPNPPNPLATM